MNDQFSPLLFYSSLYKVCGSHFSFTNGHHTCKIIPPVNLHFTVFDKVVSPYSQGCQAGSILHRLSWLLAAATRVLTRLSAPSKVARSEILQSEVKINNSEFPKAKNCRFFLSLTCPTSFFNLMSIRGKNILSQKNVSPTQGIQQRHICKSGLDVTFLFVQVIPRD